MTAKIRRWIDPRTRDYIVEAGGFREDAGFTSKVTLALGTRRGSCLVSPSFGSRMYKVRHVDEANRNLAKVMAEEAVAHLSDEVEDLKVEAFIPPGTIGRIDLVVSGRRQNVLLRATYAHAVP